MYTDIPIEKYLLALFYTILTLRHGVPQHIKCTEPLYDLSNFTPLIRLRCLCNLGFLSVIIMLLVEYFTT